MTYEEMYEFASYHDGECKVAIDVNGSTWLALPNQPLPHNFIWDYFFTDEPEHFDYERFGIERPEEFSCDH